jgi:hypothetical protein
MVIARCSVDYKGRLGHAHSPFGQPPETLADHRRGVEQQDGVAHDQPHDAVDHVGDQGPVQSREALADPRAQDGRQVCARVRHSTSGG